MKVISIYKKYLCENAETGGYWRMKMEIIETTIEEFCLGKELYSPFYKAYKDITLAVKKNSGYEIWNDNPIASELFGMRICGDVLIALDNERKIERLFDDFAKHIAKIEPNSKLVGSYED